MRQGSTSLASAVGAPRVRRWAVLRRKRSVPHLERKLYHFLMGMICFGLYGFVLSWNEALIVLASVGGTFVLLDLTRLHFPRINDVVLKYLGGIMRREELRSVSGNSFYVFGLLSVVLFFPARRVCWRCSIWRWAIPLLRWWEPDSVAESFGVARVWKGPWQTTLPAVW